MFGNKNKNAELVGAKAKLARAQEMKDKHQIMIKSKREGKETSPAVAVGVIYAFSLILVVALMEGAFQGGFGIRTGMDGFDRLFFGGSIMSITGTPDIDYGLVVALRAALVTLLAGVIPFATWAWQHMLDRASTNLYYATWGTIVGLPCVVLVIKDFFGPMVMEVVDIFFG